MEQHTEGTETESRTGPRDAEILQTPSSPKNAPPPPRTVKENSSGKSGRALILLGVGLVLLILAGIGYASVKSSPGSLLYSLKTYILEHGPFTKLTESSNIASDIEQMELRLAVLKSLARDTATSTEKKRLATLATANNTQALEIITSIDTAASFTETERIDVLARLAAITKAEEVLAQDTEELASIADALEETQKAVDDSLETHITHFASTSPAETVKEYLSAKIGEVGMGLTSVAPGSDAQRRAIARIEDANDAIASGDVAKAIIFILGAQESIAVDTYLFDAERGAVEGVPLPPPVTREGQ